VLVLVDTEDILRLQISVRDSLGVKKLQRSGDILDNSRGLLLCEIFPERKEESE